MPLRHLKETQNAGAIGAPLGGNRANPGKHPRGNSGAIGGAIGPPPGGNWDPPTCKGLQALFCYASGIGFKPTCPAQGPIAPSLFPASQKGLC